MASSGTTTISVARHGRDQLERLSFFSDAVFAIAMTLLVVEVKLPHVEPRTDAALGQALLDLIPNYIGFLVSFLVLARFWTAHHTILGDLKSVSPKLVRINLLLLLAVAFMPFPTAVISEYVQLRVGIGFYTAWLVLLGALNHWLVVAASDPALIDDGTDPRELRRYRLTSWIPLLIGIAAFVGGMVTPLFALAVLVIGSPIISILVHRRAAALE